MLEPKIRIQLKNELGAIVADRLVSFKSETYTGPKDKHQGPLKIEVDLHDKESIALFKTYLDKLVGDLPIGEKKSAIKKIENIPEHPIDEMIEKIEKLKDQDKVTLYLKERDYRFITFQVLEELMKERKVEIDFDPGIKNEEFQYLVRMIKEAKNPINDKYDFSLLIGIKIIGKPRTKILVYKNGKYLSTLPIPPAEIPEINMKEKKKLTVFPQYMTIDERKKWRYYHKKFTENKELNPGELKFYQRWAEDVRKLNKKEV